MTTVTNKNGIEFDIDALATDVNGKADKDLSNATPSSSFGSMFMPDYSSATTFQSGFVADKNYIGFCCPDFVSEKEVFVKCDNVYVYRYYGGAYEKQNGSQWLVPKGSTVTFSSTSWAIPPTLYPFKYEN